MSVTLGDKFSRLTVTASIEKPVGERRHWLCRCDCGNTVRVSQSNLIGHRQQSCGCLRTERIKAALTKHGMTGTPEYFAWFKMKTRCYKPTDNRYKTYGARGIKVCDRWRRDFAAFFADMGPRPSANHSIDRIDNDRDYGPDNCRWATDGEQANNTTKNRLITVSGKTMTVAFAAAHYDVAYASLYAAVIEDGKDPARAIAHLRAAGSHFTPWNKLTNSYSH